MKTTLILALLGVIAADKTEKENSAALDVEEQMKVFNHEDNEDEVEEEGDQEEGLLQDDQDVHQEEDDVDNADDDNDEEDEQKDARFINDDSDEEDEEFVNENSNKLGQLYAQYGDFMDAAADADEEDLDNIIQDYE